MQIEIKTSRVRTSLRERRKRGGGGGGGVRENKADVGEEGVVDDIMTKKTW